MACEYCKHESASYIHHKDESNRDVYTRVAKPLPFDECNLEDSEPMISWDVKPHVIDWADHLPRLCVTAYDSDSYEDCICIPIRYCPMCGRKLPTSVEVSE